LIIDGKLNQKTELNPDPQGNWESTIDISKFPFGKSKHTLCIYTPAQKIVSSTQNFTVDIEVQGNKIKIADPKNDDTGLKNNYIKPTHESFKGQMDIQLVEATTFGGNLQVELTMGDVSNTWLPLNGFDHVCFHVFIDMPGMSESRILPKINAPAPMGLMGLPLLCRWLERCFLYFQRRF